MAKGAMPVGSPPTAHLSGGDIDAVSLRFTDVRFEDRFRQSRVEERSRGFRRWAAVALALFLVAGAFDWWLLGADATPYLTFRYFFIAPIAVLLTVSAYVKALQRWMTLLQLALLLLLVAALVFLVATVPFPASDLQYLTLLSIVTLPAWFSQMRFVWTPVLGIVALAAYVAAAARPEGVPDFVMPGHLLAGLLIVVISGVLHYVRERQARRAFRNRLLRQRQVRHVGRLAEDMETARESRSRFLSNVSNELRTPVNAMIGLIRYMADQPQDARRDIDFDKLIHQLEITGEYMREAISDVWDMAQAEAGGLELKESGINIEELLQEAVAVSDRLRRADDPPTRIAVAAEMPRLWADRERVLDIATHIVGNIRKSCRPGHTVELRTYLDRSGSVVISGAEVDDPNAPADSGESPEDQMIVTAREGAKTDLALPFIRVLADRHGGEVWVDEDTGGRTRITVLFPLERTIRPD
jgi:signal transduction histidine kinase